MAGEDPDAVDLGQMPRTHRRRREKKLMTMEEVNEKFPLIKYKTWRSTQAEKGLPTAGGINTDPTSRPASVRNVPLEPTDAGKHEELAATRTVSTSADVTESTDAHGIPEEVKTTDAQPSSPRPKTAASSAPETPVQKVTTNEEDEDDHIQTAVPAEQLPDPGDTCAICIDTLEDDDDVRGLSCGHAFHASCVDPWLTSRRACCPLCKADYYVPKPRPEAQDGQPGAGQPGIAPPQFAFMGRDRRPTMVLPGRFMSIVYDERDRYGFPRVVREETPAQRRRRERREQRQRERSGQTEQTTEATTVPPATEIQEAPQQSWRSRLRMPRIGGFNRGSGAHTLVASEGMMPPNNSRDGQSQAPEVVGLGGSTVTPAQLEAGQQQSTRT